MLTRSHTGRGAVWKILGLSVLAAAAAGAHADEAGDQQQQASDRDLDEIVISAHKITGPDEAPSQGSLVATQPRSIISGSFVQNNDSPLANYTDIIKFTPSVWTVDPNGPGMMENLATSIRGFQDGFFNVTFDGIPWGDSNDFTHHSTSYFMAQDIGAVAVDRGPGDASTLGDATFGGTVAVQSDDPRPVRTLSALLSGGSFGMWLSGLRYDTGTIDDWGGTRAYIDVKSFTSDGYLSNAGLWRENAFAKVIQPLPIGDSTTITFATNLNKLAQHPPIGATEAQMAAFGVNYSYNTNPASQAYYGYNLDKISTDFEYLGISSQFNGWRLNNDVYTYAYYHDGWNGEDPNGQEPDGVYPPGDVPNGTMYGPNDVPGQLLTNNYRSVGDIFRLEHDLGPGVAQIGAWYDHQTNYRALVEVDMTDNEAFNPSILGNTVPNEIESADRLMHDQLFTNQEYLQYVWHAWTGLDLTAGIKAVRFERDQNAPVNQGTLQPLLFDETWSRNLGSFDAHYKITDDWSAYAQWAQGFLAPNLNVLYTGNPAESYVKPQATTNYQAGTTWTNHALSLSADVYYIDFNNEIASKTIEAIKIFYNEGGTRYKGVEAEGSYVLGAGFTLYANGSINSAHSITDGTWVPDTPIRTGAIGLMYKQGPVQGSLMDRYVGARYGDVENAYPLGGYSTVDGALNYTFLQSAGLLRDAKIGVTAQNLFNKTSIYFLSGYTGGGTPLWFGVPGRSFEVTLSASIQ
jgi:iron complex outermembrane recepter protein